MSAATLPCDPWCAIEGDHHGPCLPAPAPSRPPCRVCERPRADHGGEDDGIREDGVQICDGYEPSRLPTPEEHVRAVREADRASGSVIGLLTQDHVRLRDAAVLARLDEIAKLDDSDRAEGMLERLRAELRGAP